MPTTPAEWFAQTPHFFCEHLKVKMACSRCYAAQLSSPPLERGAARVKAERAPLQGGVKWSTRSPVAAYCRSGRCPQGLQMLLAGGLAVRRECPVCQGSAAPECICKGAGWVPMLPSEEERFLASVKRVRPLRCQTSGSDSVGGSDITDSPDTGEAPDAGGEAPSMALSTAAMRSPSPAGALGVLST